MAEISRIFDIEDQRWFAAASGDCNPLHVRELTSRRSRPLTIFYPSTVALDEPTPDLLEYTMAKAIGERLCAQLQNEIRGLKIVVDRLPRIATRQTETFLKVKSNAPEATMLPIVRAVQSTRAV